MSNSPARGIANVLKKKERQSKQAGVKKSTGLIRDNEMFRAIKPKSRFLFHSDYFQVDNTYATILTVMHNVGADDNLPYFWGIQLIPRRLDNDISVRVIQHVSRMSESWLGRNQGRAEGVLNNRSSEQDSGSTLTSKGRLGKEKEQMGEIARELMEGATYLRVAFRLLVKAPTLEQLDDAVDKINRQYKDKFDTVFAASYVGEQKHELSTLFGKVDSKLGRNFMFTSTEFSGSYNLVTRGIEDPRGEYIGQMEGDVNNSAVLMDIDDYETHVVIAGRAEAQTLSGYDFKGQRGVDVWGAKLGMCALLRNKRVIHLVLNRAKIANIGVDLTDITSNVDMTRGDINPFEMFGEEGNELSIFPAHLEKIHLMVEQMYPMPASKSHRIRSALNQVLNDFYTDKRMWVRNAQENKQALRLINIPHHQVPRLPVFQSYLDMEYKGQVMADNKDDAVMDAYGSLRGAFQDMMDSNGDLFNTETSNIIDNAAVSSRVIYDFSSLLTRSRGIMMGQFVNALGFAVGSLRKGDVVILHGVEQMHDGVTSYVRDKFDQLNDNGVRTVFIYNSIDTMIQDKAFNRFESADYTLLGGMNASTIDLYESTLKQEVPYVLKSLLTHKERYRYYLRRGFDNVVFAWDIQMGFNG